MIFIFALILMSCQTSIFTYTGKVAKSEIRLPIVAGGSQSGYWKTYDLQVDYQYSKRQNDLKISGDIYLRSHSSYVETFTIWIHFLDRDNRILDTRLIQSHPYRSQYYGLDFNTDYQLPDGTEAFGFSYTGVTRGHGDDGGWDFWLDPRRANRYGFFY